MLHEKGRKFLLHVHDDTQSTSSATKANEGFMSPYLQQRDMCLECHDLGAALLGHAKRPFTRFNTSTASKCLGQLVQLPAVVMQHGI